MGKIQVLSKNISDKIAAGEVVERPASVIKELLENAVDAGSTQVCVEIKNGGISYMRVTDNGIGMTREDVTLSVIRHATSKIATEEDLTRIHTLGFRGEALSSIAAVSKLEIYTRAKGEDIGTHMTALNGEIIDIAEAGCPEGTTVLVRELFCTVPARMKFLKKDFTEAGYIEDIVARLALSHPELSVKFINNGKEIIFTPGDSKLSSAIYAVYGKDIKNAMIEADYHHQGVHVFGMCGKAQASRPNRNMENFFVNGRYIKSPLLARATEEAYKNELMVGKFPTCVLNIILPPEHVDINIHPTKLEAKFADEKQVYHCVYWAVKNALYAAEFVPEVSEHKAIKAQYVRPKDARDLFVKKDVKPVAFTEEKISVTTTEPIGKGNEPTKTDAISAIKEQPKPVEPVLKKPYTEVKKPISFVMRENGAIPEREETPVSVKTYMPEIDTAPFLPKQETKPIVEEQKETVAQDSTEPKLEPPEYRIVGQVLSTYIIVEKDGQMLMVDQHAAHERLRYEKLLVQYQNREVTSQLMLCPEVVDLSATEFACFLEHHDTILDLGFQADEFGTRQIIVRGTPATAGECDAKSAILEILGMLAEGRKRIDDEMASRMLYRIACRGAVKANAVLTHAEMKTLLDEVFSLNGINTCPHGRPITVEFTKSFIEKQFKRIV